MREIGTRLLRTLRVERENFVWMDFTDRATGDAFYLVVITAVLTFFGLTSFGLLSLVTNATAIVALVFIAIDGIVYWLVFAGVTYAIIRFLYQEHHNYPAILRISGYAYPTRILLVFFARYLDSAFLVFLLSSGWFLYIVARGVVATSDVALEKALVAAGGGAVGAAIIEQILLT